MQKIEATLKCKSSIFIKSKWFWGSACLLLYLGICLVGGSLQLAVGLGIFLGGLVSWIIVVREFLLVSNEKKIKYLTACTSAKPDTFSTFMPILRNLRNKT